MGRATSALPDLCESSEPGSLAVQALLSELEAKETQIENLKNKVSDLQSLLYSLQVRHSRVIQLLRGREGGGAKGWLSRLLRDKP